MKKNIAVIGTGYVGLVTAAGLADCGHAVTAVDIDWSRIRELKKGNVPFFEPGLRKLVRKSITAGKLRFTVSGDEAVAGNEVIIIAVGTPPAEDGRVDLSQLNNAADLIFENLDSRKTIIIKSTVPPGTTDRVRQRLFSDFDRTGSGIVFCPEFLREGSAVHDFFHPDRIVIGGSSVSAARCAEEVFYPVISPDVPVLKCSAVSAELIKYCSNVMLASRIAVINEIAELSEAAGGDMRDVSAGVGLDKRIGREFLNAGPGFGGSCFGKDVAGIVKAAEYLETPMPVTDSILRSNDIQKRRPAVRLEKMTGSLKGKRVAVLGLAFKAETDDVRGSAAFEVIDYLISAGAQVKAHDPCAEYNFISSFCRKGYNCEEKSEDALRRADAVIILTDWKDYGAITPDLLASLMRGRTVVDTRNVLDEHEFRRAGFHFAGTGRPAVKPVPVRKQRSEIVNAALVAG